MYLSDKDTHDNGIAMVEYDNGARASHMECFVTPISDRRYTIVGELGQIEASLTDRIVTLRPRWSKEIVTYQIPDEEGDLTSPTLFEEVTFGLNLPGVASMLENLMRTPGAPAPHPMESINFSTQPGRNTVQLPVEEKDIQFRAIRCVNFLLIINKQ